MYPLKWKQRGRDPLEALLILSAKAALFHSACDLSTYACQIIYTIPRTSFYPYLCQTSLLNNFSVNCTINFKQNLVIPLCITLKFRSTLSKQPNYTALTKKLAMTNDWQELHNSLPTTEEQWEEIWHLI